MYINAGDGTTISFTIVTIPQKGSAHYFIEENKKWFINKNLFWSLGMRLILFDLWRLIRINNILHSMAYNVFFWQIDKDFGSWMAVLRQLHY